MEVTPIGVRLFIQRALGSAAAWLVPNPTASHQLAVSDAIPPWHVDLLLPVFRLEHHLLPIPGKRCTPFWHVHIGGFFARAHRS